MQTAITENGTRAAQARVLHYRFRWTVIATGDKTIEVRVPTGDGRPVLDEGFVDGQELTLAEVRKAEELVLASIAIIEQPGKVS